VTASGLVDANGNWEVLLTDQVLLAGQECICGERVAVRAYCVQDPVCEDTWPEDSVLECPPEVPVCPSLVSFGANAGPCNLDGSRDVTVTAMVNAPAQSTLELHDSTGMPPLASVSGTGLLTLSGTRPYTGAVTFSVAITAPSGCPSFPSFPQTFPPCEQCPTITEADPVVGDCDASGNRPVTVAYTLQSPDSYTVELRQQDANGAVLVPPVTVSGAHTLSYTGSYPADSSQTFYVAVTSPSICGGATFHVSVPRCDCPTVNWGEPVFGECDDQGRRDVSVTATLNASGPYTAELQDAAGTVGSVAGSGAQTLTYTNRVSGGTSLALSVVVTAPTGCGGSSRQVAVPLCPAGQCPQVSIDPIDETALVCTNGMVEVSVSATVAPTVVPTVVHWEYDGGSPDPATTISTQGSTTVTGTHAYPGDGGTHSATLSIDQPAGICDPSSISFSVPQCPPTPPPPPSDESAGCLGLRIAIAVLAALGFLFAMLAGCLGVEELYYVSGGFLTVAAVLLVIYALFCPNKPCSWALLLTGQILLGTGVAAIILSNCCTWMQAAGAVSLVIGIGLLLLWRSQCDQSFCRLAKEVTFVIGGITLPLIGAIASAPVIQACIDGIASAAVSAIFGPIAAFAASCRE
jgi:hypothetical protein